LVPGWISKYHPVKLWLGFRRERATAALNLFSGREAKQAERQPVAGCGFLCLG